MASENTYILYETKPSRPLQETDGDSISSTQDLTQLITDNTTSVTRKGNLAQTSFNYINSIIGSGIVGIPYALQQVGFGMGIILLLVIAIATDYSLCIMIEAASSAGVTTYQALIQSQFGRTGYYFLTAAQFIYPFIAMISYNIIIGDTTTKVFIRIFGASRSSILGNRHFIVFISTLFVTLPFSLFRGIVELSIVSLLSLSFAASITLFVLVRAFTMTGVVPTTPDAYQFANSGITEAIGVIAFAFMCHHNSFLLYDALENPSQARWNRVTHISMGISCLIILVFGVSGYVTFTEYCQGDLLENFCTNDDWANAARLVFTVTIMLTYPIECFVTREVFENAVFEEKKSTVMRHSILTICLVIAAFVMSTLTDCLSIVLELNGVLAAVPLAYVLPSAAYIKATEGKIFSLQKAPAIIIALSGIILAVYGTIKVVFDIWHGISCSHGAEMSYCKNSLQNNLTSINEYANMTVPTFE